MADKGKKVALQFKLAFTLLELSAVLLISGLMLNFLLSASQQSNPVAIAACVSKTKAQLVQIRAQIEIFARRNDRLPMPAARNVSADSTIYGREASGADIDTVGSGSTAVSYGALPFQALGLPVSYAGDCWGNKYTYAVNTALTTNAASGGFLDSSLEGSITVNRTDPGSSNITTNNKIAYAVLSHGVDALGAVKLTYSAANGVNTPPYSGHSWCSGSSIAHINCTATSNILIDAVYNDGKNAGSNYFDDIIVSAQKPKILSTTGYYVYGWGYNYGQISGAASASRSTPKKVYGGIAFATLSTDGAGKYACGLTSGGVAYCWGYNAEGELGDGTTLSRAAPTAVSGGLTFTSIEVSTYFVCGLTSGGVAYCWGKNNYGQLGDGTTTDRSVPTAVAGGLTFTSLAINKSVGNVCGLTSGGTAYCWGRNDYGQVGDNSTTQRSVPTAVSGALTFASLTLGPLHTCGLTSGGTAYCWGYNGYGNIGDNSTTHRSVPTAVSGGLTFSSLLNGGYYNCGLTSGGAAYCWGYNAYGNLGDNSTTNRSVPTAVSGGLTFSTLVQRDAAYTTCGLTSTGAAYCWGYNAYGQVGDGTTTNRLVPTAVIGGLSFANLTVTQSGTDYTVCGLTTAGVAYCWGSNSSGQIGDGTTTARSVPTAVRGGYIFAKLYGSTTFTCGLTNAGDAYCWGSSYYGQLGDLNSSYITGPLFTPGTYYTAIAMGAYHGCGLATSGQTYCWGSNGVGQLGDGTTTDHFSPGIVSGGLTFASIAAGINHTCGLTSSGAAYCWGNNTSGQLGDGTTTSRWVPTAVSGGLTFKSLVASERYTCGLTSAGVAYCWGNNSSGRLGDGTTTARLVPTAVTGGLTFTSLAVHRNRPAFAPIGTTCGVAVGGAAYCWGYNTSGQVGDGTTTTRLVPTAVSGGLSFSKIASGPYTSCGVTTGGAAYCWGNNNGGQVGDGTTTDRLVPTAVSGGLTFSSIVVTENTNCGLTTAGTAYCWGDNNYGVLGDGTTTTRLVPTAVAGGLKFVSGSLQGATGSTYGTFFGLVDTTNTCSDILTSGKVPDGTTEYLYSSLTPSSSCTAEYRTCSSGVWSGSYLQPTCTPGCDTRTITWGSGPICSATMPGMAGGGSPALINSTAGGTGSVTANCSTTGVVTLSGASCN